MPLIAVAIALVAFLLAIAILIPLSLVQRYRVGAARRPARGWVIALNLVTVALSTVIFLVVAAVTNTWVPDAFRYALLGLAAGSGLGLVGLGLTRWDPTPQTLHYTPNRWLVLAVTLVVTMRLLYGFWRGWEVWRVSPDDTSWVVATGVAGSLAAGAVVLGYYLVYWIGVRRRFRRYLMTAGASVPRSGWPTTRGRR
jgi:hypothetical protein